MKKVKYWLHIPLTLLTGFLWLPVYVIVIATTEMFNRGYREGKAAGRREIAADPEWMRVSEYKGSGAHVVEPGCTSVHIVSAGGGGSGGCVGAPNKVREFEGRSGTVRVPVWGANDVPAPKGVSRFDRFKELGDRMLSGDPLDSYEQLEYQELRKEVVR